MSRSDVAREILADPPQVHQGAPGGVWRTFDECYQFMAEVVPRGGRTLEVGVGISTALLASWRCDHTCVAIDQGEADELIRYLQAHGDPPPPRFEIGPSQDVLPRLEVDPVDMFLIDGSHGFPHPAIDWFYGARFLRDGGVCVLDDMQIPAVAQTIGWFLDLDPRWEELHRDGRWAAYRRHGEGALSEEWWDQLFLGDPR